MYKIKICTTRIFIQNNIVVTVILRPSEEMRQEAADDVVADGVHVSGGVFGDEGGHIQDIAG